MKNTFKAIIVSILFLFAASIVSAQSSCHSQLSPSLESFVHSSAAEQMQRITRGEELLGVSRQNQTQFLLHRDSNSTVLKTNHSVVIYHGLWNSPSWTKWLADIIYEMGFNVINVRLPKHNHGRIQDINRLTLEDFVSQTQVISGIAEEIGQKVIYIGHSAGGNSAILSAISNIDSTSGLISLAPALEVRPSVKRWSFLLGRTFLSNIPLNWLPETYERYRSLGAGRATHYFAEHLRAWDNSEDFEGLANALSHLNVLQLDVLNDGTVSNEVNTEVARMSGVSHIVFSESLAHVNMLDPPERYENGSVQRDELNLIFKSIIDFITDIQNQD